MEWEEASVEKEDFLVIEEVVILSEIVDQEVVQVAFLVTQEEEAQTKHQMAMAQQKLHLLQNSPSKSQVFQKDQQSPKHQQRLAVEVLGYQVLGLEILN